MRLQVDARTRPLVADRSLEGPALRRPVLRRVVPLARPRPAPRNAALVVLVGRLDPPTEDAGLAVDNALCPLLRRIRLNARVLKPALRRAGELRQKRGLPPLPPGVTVHTLRRTYVSLMLAAGADLRWVQGQVGHEDAKMTLEVYTQVLQRKDRELYTEAFDRLMADAIPSAATPRMSAESGTEAGGFTGIPAS